MRLTIPYLDAAAAAKWAALSPLQARAVLDAARLAVTSDRNKQYGEPEDNFRNIAQAWNSYLDSKYKICPHITPIDVAYMMILMKVCRATTSPHNIDHQIDIAGYAACAARCKE